MTDPQNLASACADAMFARDQASQRMGMRLLGAGPGIGRADIDYCRTAAPAPHADRQPVDVRIRRCAQWKQRQRPHIGGLDGCSTARTKGVRHDLAGGVEHPQIGDVGADDASVDGRGQRHGATDRVGRGAEVDEDPGGDALGLGEQPEEEVAGGGPVVAGGDGGLVGGHHDVAGAGREPLEALRRVERRVLGDEPLAGGLLGDPHAPADVGPGRAGAAAATAASPAARARERCDGGGP